MPNQPATKNRVIRVPDDVWDGAKTAAARAGETVTTVITRALHDYVTNPPAQGSQQRTTETPCPRCGRATRLRGGGGAIPARHKDTEGQWCE